MEKQSIYYGELVPIAGCDQATIPAIMILQDDTEEHNGLPGRAEEAMVSLKEKLSLAPGCLKNRRLVRVEEVMVLTARVCAVDKVCQEGLAGCLNGATMQYVDHVVAAGFGLEEVLAQSGACTEKQKECGEDNDSEGV